MVETVFPDLFRIEVPLPGNPLKSVNSYVVRGLSRNLVVDTGMSRPECHDALKAGLEELGIDERRTDFFITHFHADHLGLVSAFAAESSLVFLNAPEAGYMAAHKTPGGFMPMLAEHARMEGFPEEALRQVFQLHPGFKYSPPNYPGFEVLHDGDTLRAGDYAFTCVHTPGHTPGHMCLYEPRKKLLISGDHVLGGITPNIASWIDDSDTLGNYFASLDRVCLLDVELVLPGHRQTFHDLRGRVRELKEHHQQRLEEALAILRARPSTVYEVASQMTWDIVAKSWEDFPVLQKWFATGEAGSHLRHLEETGSVRRIIRNGAFTYSHR
jgi:glyoxylase-like metal-dependent hydrolase (beta-lactamase superfamily II)